MSTPIYRNEASWRAHMLVSDLATRAKLDRVQLTIIGALFLYFVSIYSVPAALAVLRLLVARHRFCCALKSTKARRKQLDALNEDANLDL